MQVCYIIVIDCIGLYWLGVCVESQIARSLSCMKYSMCMMTGRKNNNWFVQCASVLAALSGFATFQLQETCVATFQLQETCV